jgi:hypothetical protein
MKRELLVASLLVASLGVVSAEAPNPSGLPSAWADRLFGPPANRTHDFGRIPRGAQPQHRFVLTNIYAVPIEISSVRVSMAPVRCTASKWKLEPGETALIDVVLDGRRFVGKKTVSIYVLIGDPGVSETRLTVTAETGADTVCNPGQVDFGTVPTGMTATETVDIEYVGKLAWQVTEVVVPKGAPFRATVRELYRRPGQVGYQVEVSLKKGAASGPLREILLIKTSDPEFGQFSLPVCAEVRARPAGE